MNELQPIGEDEMIAAFLKMEWDSARFGPVLRELLARDGREVGIVTTPDLASADDNRYRRSLLAWRGYGQNTELFVGFPADIQWFRTTLSPGELLATRYINDDYWVNLSAGSRRPQDAAEAIRQGIDIFGVRSADFLDLAHRMTPGQTFPELILVGTTTGEPLIVLEGHVRLTVYALLPATQRLPQPVLIGYSPRLTAWVFY